MNYVNHEVSSLLPEMNNEEYQVFKEDIQNTGIKDVVIDLFEGKILDGRHRYKAAKELNIVNKLKFVEFKGTYIEAVEYVWSKNFHRRNIDSFQRAVCVIAKEELVNKFRMEAKEKQKEAYKQQERKEDGTFKPLCEKIHKADKPRDVKKELAKIAKTNPHYICDAQKLKKNDPEAFEAIKKGATKWTDYKKEKNKEVRKEKKKIIDHHFRRIHGKIRSIASSFDILLNRRKKRGDTTILECKPNISVVLVETPNQHFDKTYKKKGGNQDDWGYYYTVKILGLGTEVEGFFSGLQKGTILTIHNDHYGEKEKDNE